MKELEGVTKQAEDTGFAGFGEKESEGSSPFSLQLIRGEVDRRVLST